MASRKTRPRGGASYLHWHGQSWRVQLAVPARLRGAIGCAVLYHPLHTDSLAIAERTKHRAIAALKDRLVAAERQLERRKDGDPWPAAGFVDTEIGCFREPEASDAEAQVQSRVQDRGGPLGA